MNIKDHIASIIDFPKKGIIFRDVTPILKDPACMKEVTDAFAKFIKKTGAQMVLAPEARGFFFGLPAALSCDIGFAPVRKPGKLPRKTITQSYDLEYGTDRLEIHEDAIQPGTKVVIIDDLLATGGTMEAIVKMVEHLQGEVVGIGFVIELDDLKGRDKFKDIPILALTHYQGE